MRLGFEFFHSRFWYRQVNLKNGLLECRRGKVVADMSIHLTPFSLVNPFHARKSLSVKLEPSRLVTRLRSRMNQNFRRENLLDTKETVHTTHIKCFWICV